MTTYEPGFKEQAIKLASEVGSSRAAQDLGIPINTLYTWVKNVKVYGENAYVGSGRKRKTNVNSNSQVSEQAKRIKELEHANQILKEASSFFVVSQRK